MTSPADLPAPERTFRTRALAVLLGVGLLPTLALGALGHWAMEGALSVSFERLESLLERVDGELPSTASELREQLAESRLYLAQAELARGALVRRAPTVFVAILGTVGRACLLPRPAAGPAPRAARGGHAALRRG